MQNIGELTIFFPGKLVFGKGKIIRIVDEIKNFSAEKVLIITIEPFLRIKACH